MCGVAELSFWRAIDRRKVGVEVGLRSFAFSGVDRDGFQ